MKLLALLIAAALTILGGAILLAGLIGESRRKKKERAYCYDDKGHWFI